MCGCALTPGAVQTRPAGKLYFGGLGASEQSLSYLDGSLPADYGCAARARRRGGDGAARKRRGCCAFVTRAG